MSGRPSSAVHRPWPVIALGGMAVAVLGLISVSITAGHLSHGRPLHGLSAAAIGTSLLVVVLELLIRPAVFTTSEGVTLTNPFRSVFVPWPMLEATDGVSGLRLMTAEARYVGWAAHGPGTASAFAAGRAIELENPFGLPRGMDAGAGPTVARMVSGGDDVAGPSRSAAKHLVDREWRRWQSAGSPAGEECAAVRIVWHRLSIVVGVSAVFMGTGAVLLGRA